MFWRELLECYKELVQYTRSSSTLKPQAVICHPSLRLEWKFIKLSTVLEKSVCWEKQTNKLFQNHLC